jgi:hypothetical protein
MRWLSLFVACQHLNSGKNLRECEDQSWFKVQAVPVFRSDWSKTVFVYPLRCPRIPPGVRVPHVEDHCHKRPSEASLRQMNSVYILQRFVPLTLLILLASHLRPRLANGHFPSDVPFTTLNYFWSPQSEYMPYHSYCPWRDHPNEETSV